MNELPFPSWYNSKLVGNPLFMPNQNLIKDTAVEMAKTHNIKVAKNIPRIACLHVDYQTCFDWPLTYIDFQGGVVNVVRVLPSTLKGDDKIPTWWNEDYNQIIWFDDVEDFASIMCGQLSLAGGHLSVAGAWNDVLRLVEWCLKYAHLIWLHVLTADAHPFTARFDMHYYVACNNNPFVKDGEYPRPYMDGKNPFLIITPENLWHPEHNPSGIWKPVVTDKKFLDETWFYTKKLGVVVGWFMHGQRLTQSGLIDPIVMAATMHHTFLNGGFRAEPIFLNKGESWRTEFFAAFAAEYRIFEDQFSESALSAVQLLTGYYLRGMHNEPCDYIIVVGQALSHCVLRTLQEIVSALKAAGREDLISKIIFLRDCSSSIPGFEEETEKALKELQKEGLRIETTETLDLEKL